MRIARYSGASVLDGGTMPFETRETKDLMEALGGRLQALRGHL